VTVLVYDKSDRTVLVARSTDIDIGYWVSISSLEYCPAHPEPQKEAEKFCVNETPKSEPQKDLSPSHEPQRWSPHPHAQDGKCVICDEVKHRNAAGCCLDCYKVPEPELKPHECSDCGQPKMPKPSTYVAELFWDSDLCGDCNGARYTRLTRW
jgi:hypothetical protein